MISDLAWHIVGPVLILLALGSWLVATTVYARRTQNRKFERMHREREEAARGVPSPRAEPVGERAEHVPEPTATASGAGERTSRHHPRAHG